MSTSTIVGIITDIVIVLILIGSFIGGAKGGFFKGLVEVIAFIIALLVSGIFLDMVYGWLSFIGDTGWRSFLAFLLTMGIIIILVQLILWLPRHLLEKIWNSGFIFGLLGGILGFLNAALGLVLLVKLLGVYQVLPWLSSIFATSHVLNWLVSVFGPIITSLSGNAVLHGVTASIFSYVV
jgi:hypothetical protein